MKRGDVIRLALAFLLGGGAAAAGRAIPVYREYTQPILFYDEEGVRTEFDAVPDLDAIRGVRDARAQEAMVGRAAPLEVDFAGRRVALGTGPLPLAGPPAVAGGREGRGPADDSDRNWLANSLSLPGLGRQREPAAGEAAPPAAQESGWGWLADQIAENPLPEALPTEPAVALPEPKVQTDASAGVPAAQGWSGGADPGANLVSPGRRLPAAGADMSRTRQALADFTSGVERPDFAAMRKSLVGGPADAPGRLENLAVMKMDRNSTTNSMPASLFAGGSAVREERPGFGTDQPAAATTSWRGGWDGAKGWLDPASEEGRKRPFDTTIAAQSVTDVSAGERDRPAASGGGFKPAWY